MLKFLATAPAQTELSELKKLPKVEEALLEHAQLARTGELSTLALQEQLQKASDSGLRPIISWDVLATDEGILNGGALLRTLNLPENCAIRAQDVGVAQYLREQFPQYPLQLVLETGNHNLVGLQSWVQALQPERVILSNELPIDLIRKAVDTLGVPVEIAVLGRLLIFYSPRPLVRAAEGGELDAVRHRYAIEEEKQKAFPILENAHGTFMYYEKDLSILPWLNEVEAAGVAWARLDFKYFDYDLFKSVEAWLANPTEPTLAKVKSGLSYRTTRGFFKSNRTDKQFDKLTNPNLRLREGRPLLATILESNKKENYMALQTHDSFKVGDLIDLVIPEGDILPHEVVWIRSANGSRVEIAEQPGLWLINHARRTSSGTRVYRESLDTTSS